MTLPDFTNNLREGLVYEKLINKWINELYDERVDIKKAIRTIHERRFQNITNMSKPLNIDDEIQRNYDNALRLIENCKAYINLIGNEKQSIRMRIEKLAKTNLYSYREIVDQMLHLITDKREII